MPPWLHPCLAQVLYSFPAAMPADLEQGLAAFCFPHGVRPELLERTPSMSGGWRVEPLKSRSNASPLPRQVVLGCWNLHALPRPFLPPLTCPLPLERCSAERGYPQPSVPDARRPLLCVHNEGKARI